MTAIAEIKTFSEVWSDLWRARFFVTAGAAAGILLAALYVMLAVPFYRADMIVSPANPISGTDVISVPGGDSMLATPYKAQYVGNDNSYEFMRFENMIAGPSVAGILLKDETILKGLNHERRFVFLKPDTVWNAEKFAEYIRARVRTEPIGETPLRRLVYFHPSSDFAAYFMNRLHAVTDQIIRSNVKEDAAERVRYLQQALDSTNNPEHRRVLTALLMEQERLRMLASIDQPYAAAMVEPPAVSYRPRWPDRLMVFASLLVAGCLAGFMIHGVRNTR
ncbi:MAG: hypothetical protein IT558_00980 [Alphaproteobacteria bacterium]|nr:hypothetical protein [Alphaproteobacteria bacterium]